MTGLFDPLTIQPAPTVDEITQTFNEFDGGGSGLLSAKQALSACQDIANIPFNKSELQAYVKEGLDVAGDGNSRIKLAPFASYLAFECAKKVKSLRAANTTNIGPDYNPFVNVQVSVTSVPSVDNVDSSAAQELLRRSASPTAASSIPAWFGHPVDNIHNKTYVDVDNDPFAMFDMDTKNNLTLNKAASHPVTIRDDWHLGGITTNKKPGNHMAFPSHDILFDDEPNSNDDDNKNNVVSKEPNISPKYAKQKQKGLIAPPRAKGEKPKSTTKKKKKKKKKKTQQHSGATPVADFTFSTIAEQAQHEIDKDMEDDSDDSKSESSSDSDSGSGKLKPALRLKNVRSVNDIDRVVPVDLNAQKKKRPKLDAIVLMQKGAAMLKYGRRGFPHFRRFQLTNDLTKVVWYSRKKSLAETNVSVKDMRDILEGQQTDVFRQCTQRTLEKASFSIVYGHKLKTLDVVAKSAEEAQLWIKGLKGLIKANNQGKLHKVIQILVDVQFKDISKANYRECTDDKRRKNEVQFKSRPDLVSTIEATLDQSKKIYRTLLDLTQVENVQNSVEWENISLLVAEIEERIQEVSYGLQNKTAELSDLKRDVWVLKVDVTVLEEKVKVLSKIKSVSPF